MGWRTTNFLLLSLLFAYGIAQDAPAGNADEHEHLMSTTKQPAGMRKDLNELPEMKRAKELQAEGEKEAIEADTMLELARLEAELKQKEGENGKTQEEKEEGSAAKESEEPKEEKPKSEEGAKEEAHEQGKEPSKEHEELKMPASDAEKHGENTSEIIEDATGNHNPEEHEKEEPPHFSLETGEEKKEEVATVEPVTEVALQQQEALVTTQKTTEMKQHHAEGEEESAGAEDPFQASSTAVPIPNTTGPNDHENGDVEQAEHEHEMEHEIVQQKVHVHHPEIGKSGENGQQAEKLPENLAGEQKNSTDSAPTHKTETLISEHDGQEAAKEAAESGSNEDAEVHHAGTMEMEAHPIGDGEEFATVAIMPVASTMGVKTEESGDGAQKQEETHEILENREGEHGKQSNEKPHESANAEEHPIVFPPHATEAETEATSAQSATTEESAVIAGDKSVFEQHGEEHEKNEEKEKLPGPEKAHIQHMSHEGEMQEKEEAEEESSHPTHAPVEHNEGSDGFEIITKEELGDAPPALPGDNQQQKTSTSHPPEEAAESEVLPTPADEEPSGAIHPEAEGEEADHTHMQMPMMSTSTVGPIPSSSTPAGTVRIVVVGEEEPKHTENPEQQATTKMAEHQPEEADTPPQRGDLPGVETSYPSEHGTTPMSEKEMATTVENEAANDLQEHETEAAFSPITTTMSPEEMEQAKAHAFRTPFSLRFPDIEWRPEFENLQSGDVKKLREQIEEELKAALTAALGPTNTLLDFELTALRKGSVILEGEMLTKEEVTEPQALVTALEQAILAKGGQLGGNNVDTDQLNVAGQMPSGSSSNLVAAGQQKQQQDATNTGLIIGGAVVVGVLIVVFAIFAIVVFGVNNRRNNCGSLKLAGGKEEICMVENGKGPFGGKRYNGFANGKEPTNGGVSLMSLRTTPGSSTPIQRAQQQQQLNGNGRQLPLANGNERPILISQSQFSPPSANGSPYGQRP